MEEKPIRNYVKTELSHLLCYSPGVFLDVVWRKLEKNWGISFLDLLGNHVLNWWPVTRRTVDMTSVGLVVCWSEWLSCICLSRSSVGQPLTVAFIPVWDVQHHLCSPSFLCSIHLHRSSVYIQVKRCIVPSCCTKCVCNFGWYTVIFAALCGSAVSKE